MIRQNGVAERRLTRSAIILLSTAIRARKVLLPAFALRWKFLRDQETPQGCIRVEIGAGLPDLILAFVLHTSRPSVARPFQAVGDAGEDRKSKKLSQSRAGRLVSVGWQCLYKIHDFLKRAHPNLIFVPF